jgi:hypothetical protein
MEGGMGSLSMEELEAGMGEETEGAYLLAAVQQCWMRE